MAGPVRVVPLAMYTALLAEKDSLQSEVEKLKTQAATLHKDYVNMGKWNEFLVAKCNATHSENVALKVKDTAKMNP